MKQLACIAVAAVFLGAFQVAYGNMAAPAEPDVGTAITLEQNETLAVKSEVLDIVIEGSTAQITATYQMENQSDEAVKTRSMFLSPNVEEAGVQVVADGQLLACETECYALSYNTQIGVEEWRYAVLTDVGESPQVGKSMVEAILFDLKFEPRETYDVIVSYRYRLGGYPEYDFNVKCGELHYYLMPAAMWNGFEDLTINLTLGKDMPVLESSSLEFEKVGKRSYRYYSDALPKEDLRITVDENWLQNLFSTLRSPYLHMMIRTAAPFILIMVLVAGWFVFRRVKRGKK